MLSQWRAMYVPGDWIVLSGPTSLVVLQPFADSWSEMANPLWDKVLASASLVELASELAAFGLEDMPSFGAFFWTSDGMRSLVRGAVTVKEAATGETVADGRGIQTWSEVGLGSVDHILIETPQQVPAQPLRLPLVLGAARVATVTLDARTGAAVRSVQAIEPAPENPGPENPAPEDPEQDEPEGQQPDQDQTDLDQDDAPDDDELTEAWPEPPPEPGDADERPAAVALMEDGETELMQLPFPVTEDPMPPVQPEALARIVLSDGTAFDLTRPVRIGRAPLPYSSDTEERSLVTVISRNSDISRSHLELAVVDGDVLATDLHSTNGTILIRPGPHDQGERLAPGTPVPVPVGSTLELGDGVSVLIEPPAHHG